MKKFLQKIGVFCSPLVLIFLGSLFFLPNPDLENNLLLVLADKHQRIDSLSSPKIIFVGGSNLSFGIDSKSVEDTLKIPVVNMGTHAGLGLNYMLHEVKPYIDSGDIVIVSPEYELFTKSEFYGHKELPAVIFDILPQAKKYISAKQWFYILPQICHYAVIKLLNRNFINPLLPETAQIVKKNTGVYAKDAFNKYGDVYKHWDMPKENFSPYTTINKPIYKEAILQLEKFRRTTVKRKAHFILLPTVLQRTSYNNQQEFIEKVNNELNKIPLPFAAPSHLYKFEDNLFFNSPYHLTKEGVDLRTKMVIDDIKSYALFKDIK